MAIKIASAKAKGRILQQTVRDEVLKRYPSLTADDVRSAPMGQTGVDLQLSSRAKQLFPFAPECKARKSFIGYKWMSQAQMNSTNGIMPIVVIKGDRKDPLVLLRLEDFFKLVKK